MDERDFKRGTGPIDGRLLCLILCFVCTALGCPTYEDGLTGRYQEADLDEFQDEAISLDFYRFGSDVRALLRRYNIASEAARQDPFAETNQTECRWTRVDRFNESERSFSLFIPATARQPELYLSGRIGEPGAMEVELRENGSPESRVVSLIENGVEPDPRCVFIDDFFLRVILDTASDLEVETYRLRHPVFAMLWVGVEPVFRDGFTFFAATNRVETPVRLLPGIHYSPSSNGLTGSLAMSIPPPPERMLMPSGSTRFALAHFVVIDDSEEEGRFSWSVNEEPIVGTSLEAGLPENLPEVLEGQPLDGWGKALLFVEGRLDELHPNMLANFSGLAEAELDRHFYIVDLFFYNQEVEHLRLPRRPQPNQPVQRRVPMQLTTEFLQTQEVRLPRLYDYD